MVLASQSPAYSVVTPIYQGPLDLLLHLIEKAELDITKVALAQVTDQFLGYIKSMPETTPDIVSSFLIIAVKLIQIKSEALLPRPPQRQPEEEDPGEALARQLKQYKQFKEVANLLRSRESANLKTFPRTAPPRITSTPKNLGNISLADLRTAANWIFSLHLAHLDLDKVITLPKINIREKIVVIAHYLRNHHKTTFTRLLPRTPIRLDIVVTFLAILELVKRQMIKAQQDYLFSDIKLEVSSELSQTINLEFELDE